MTAVFLLQRGVSTLLATGFLVCSPASAPSQEDWDSRRTSMVSTQIEARGIRDARVLAAMRSVPRHLFVPPALQSLSYEDTPLPIGEGQTISQPYIVALMTELARPAAGDRALEVGTGSGYQAAVLSSLVAQVYTVEILDSLGKEAGRRLGSMGYRNVEVKVGDGYAGWPEKAPFDVILVTAAPETVPPALLSQLKAGGRLVIPVGASGQVQSLQILEKDSSGATRARDVTLVRFVPMVRDIP
jgi:protein-L-isoaspartate(D-aspartate) O-methyltransferase